MRQRISKALFLAVLLLLIPSPATGQYGQTLQYFPQAATGGGAVTSFSLHNPGTVSSRVTVELFDPNGGQFYSSEVTIPAGGVQTMSVGVPQNPLKVGWARVRALTGQFEATEFFQLSTGGQALPRVGVLPCVPSTSMKFFAYLVKGQTNTGVAIANPSDSTTVSVVLRRFNTMGALTGTATTMLQPRSQLARFLNEDPWFVGLQDFEGIVEVQSTEPVVLLMLRSDNAMLSSAAVLTPDTQTLAPGSVTTDLIADGAVTSDKIANGTIKAADLADDSVSQGKLDVTNSSTVGQVLGTDGTQLKWQNDSLTLPFKFQGNWPNPGGWTPALQFRTDNALSLAISVPSSSSAMAGSALTVYVDSPAYFPAISSYSYRHYGLDVHSNDADAIWASTYKGYGIDAYSEDLAGARGRSPNGDGLVGISEAANKSGIYAVNANGAGYAGYFAGRVHVTGQLTKGSGAFKIDHPLDPQNRYLYHSFVESPDMKNVYDGLATLDSMGEAWVELPDWFEALNRDFRYQLTSLDVPSPGLYVAARVAGNRFKIAGGMPGAQVSWMVTGIRQDAYADAHRIPVEEDKPAEERGTFLHPEAFGQSPDKSVERIHRTTTLEKKHPATRPQMSSTRKRAGE